MRISAPPGTEDELEPRNPNGMSPDEIREAWVSMGPAGDRSRLLRLLDDAERVVREMGRDLDYLQDPKQWDDFIPGVDDEVAYLRRHIEDFNEAPFVLARLSELRQMIDRLFPPSHSA